MAAPRAYTLDDEQSTVMPLITPVELAGAVLGAVLLTACNSSSIASHAKREDPRSHATLAGQQTAKQHAQLPTTLAVN